MGAAKNFGSVTLRNSALGSVALGMLVVGAGAMPVDWTVAQPSRQVTMPLVAAPEVRRAAVAPVKWAKRTAPPKLTAVPERQFVALPVETAAAVVPAVSVGPVGPVALLPFTTPVPAAPQAETVALVAQPPIAASTPMTPRAEAAALVTQLSIAAPASAAPTVEMAALIAQLPVVAPMPATPPAETVALVAPAAVPIAAPAMRTALPVTPVETAEPALVAVSTVKPAMPVAAMRPAMADLIHVDQISTLAPIAPAAAGFAAPMPFSATPNGIAEAIYIEQISAPPARVVREVSLVAKAAATASRAAIAKLAPAAKPSAPASGERFKVTARGLEMNMAVLVNGTESGRVSLVVDANNAISMRLADVLGLVRPLMDDATFARLNAAGAAQDYVSFATLRSAGLDMRYDADLDRVTLAVADD